MPIIELINLSADAQAKLDLLLEVVDLSSDEYTMTEADIITIGLNMFFLTLQDGGQLRPAGHVLGNARWLWSEGKVNGGNHVADDHR